MALKGKKKMSRIRRVEPFSFFVSTCFFSIYIFLLVRCPNTLQSGTKWWQSNIWLQGLAFAAAAKLFAGSVAGAVKGNRRHAAKSNAQFAILRIRRVCCVLKEKSRRQKREKGTGREKRKRMKMLGKVCVSFFFVSVFIK